MMMNEELVKKFDIDIDRVQVNSKLIEQFQDCNTIHDLFRTNLARSTTDNNCVKYMPTTSARGSFANPGTRTTTGCAT